MCTAALYVHKTRPSCEVAYICSRRRMLKGMEVGLLTSGRLLLTSPSPRPCRSSGHRAPCPAPYIAFSWLESTPLRQSTGFPETHLWPPGDHTSSAPRRPGHFRTLPGSVCEPLSAFCNLRRNQTFSNPIVASTVCGTGAQNTAVTWSLVPLQPRLSAPHQGPSPLAPQGVGLLIQG